MAEIGDLRTRLDRVDAEIVDLLASRRDVVEAIIRLKDARASALRDTTREEELLERLTRLGREKGLDRYFVTRVFHEIIDYSLRIQKDHLVESRTGPVGERLRVGYQGVEGAYSFFAGRKYFATWEERLELVGFPTMRELVEAVEQQEVDRAVLPVENTTAGSINECYDLLLTKSVSVVGEEIFPVEHCLMALEEVPFHRIHRVYSHPQALAQCSDFLATLRDCHVESFTDTAMAARKVRDDEDLSQAAVASEEAARYYGLRVLKRNLANRRENFTRFMILAASPAEYDARIPCKTSLIVATGHHEGALVRCLNGLARYGLNMTKLESRPRPNVPFEYVFYIDFEGNLAEERVRAAVDELKSEAVFVKVLGTYPARNLQANQPVKVPATPRAAPGSGGTREAAHFTGSRRLSASEEVRRELEARPFRLAGRLHHPEDTVIRVRDVEIGGDELVVLAGPGTVESREQIHEAARAARESGAHVLRAGVGVGSGIPEDGAAFERLELLAEAGRRFGLPVHVEVSDAGEVARVACRADLLGVGARDMQNFALLRAVGRIDRPVVLERGLMASIEEWIRAAEYVLAQGNQQVILCERGIRTFETATRSTLDLSAVAVAREWSHLPVVVDPVQAAGVWRWVPPLALASRAAGAQGLVIRIEEPADGAAVPPEALRFRTFAGLMEALAGAGRGAAPSAAAPAPVPPPPAVPPPAVPPREGGR